jgi:hypothetical protein
MIVGQFPVLIERTEFDRGQQFADRPVDGHIVQVRVAIVVAIASDVVPQRDLMHGATFRGSNVAFLSVPFWTGK